MLITDAASAGATQGTLSAQLCSFGLLAPPQRNQLHNLLEFELDIDRKQKSRVLHVLHFISAPNCLSREGLSDIISQLQHLNELDLMSWIDKQEEIRQTIRKLYISKNLLALGKFIHQNYASMFCFDSNALYENILHQSVNDDFVQCTALLTGPYIEVQSNSINQQNYFGDSPLHLAAKTLKISQLKLLIRSPKADLLSLNRDSRNIIQLLLISLQKRWSTQRAKAISDRKMYSRSPPPTEIISLLSEILQKIFLVTVTVCSALTTRDRYQLSALDYALNLNYINILGLFISEVRGLRNLSADMDAKWSRMLFHSIFMNSPEAVAAVAAEYVRVYEQIIAIRLRASSKIPLHNGTLSTSEIREHSISLAMESDGSKISQPVDFIIEAIRGAKAKALHILLSIPLFRQNVNSSSFRGDTPLQAAVRNFQDIPNAEASSDSTTLFHIDILRTLIRQGADPLRTIQNICHKKTICPDDYGEKLKTKIEINEWKNDVGKNGRGTSSRTTSETVDYNDSEYSDNIFAFAASCGAIEAIRLLLYSCPSAVCVICSPHNQMIFPSQYVQKTQSYVQSTYLPSSIAENGSRGGTRSSRCDDDVVGNRYHHSSQNSVESGAHKIVGSGGFYFGPTRYFSNPLTHAVSAGHLLCLEYLLTTPFAQLINLVTDSSPYTKIPRTSMLHTSSQERATSQAIECTPLSIAVQSSNTAAVKILVGSNACPSIRLKAATGAAIEERYLSFLIINIRSSLIEASLPSLFPSISLEFHFLPYLYPR